MKHDDASRVTEIKLRLQGEYRRSLERISVQDNVGGVISTDQLSGGATESVGDPYTPGVAESFGLTDSTCTEGYDASSDSVGPGIYGGSVQRDPITGEILIGTEYEYDHHKPGPLYDGNGYSLMGRAIHMGEEKVLHLLEQYPQLIEEISTGGARPMHICGMSAKGQCCTQLLIDAGAIIHALDTYNYNALHRMASNDLEIGAEALVKAGLDPNAKHEDADSTPIEIAKRQRSIKFLMAMQRLGHYD